VAADGGSSGAGANPNPVGGNCSQGCVTATAINSFDGEVSDTVDANGNQFDAYGNLLNNASNVPWVFNFIASTPVEPIGPALTIAYHPATTMLFVGVGLGASEGKNASFGPLVAVPGTNSGNIDNVLSGGSISFGYNWPNLAGAQDTGNFSGSMAGPTIGVPGAGAQATYSLRINLASLYEFLISYF
jgi:hypothetical protein